MPSKNHGRMAQDMKRELIAIIGEMKDPRVSGGLLTVTRLDVTPDLDVAKVYISVMGREGGADPVVKALNKASGHIRTEVSRRMHIRKAPRFVFTKDDSAAYAVHIDQLLQDIEKAHPAAPAAPAAPAPATASPPVPPAPKGALPPVSGLGTPCPWPGLPCRAGSAPPSSSG